jgi:subfamily B ATP-binding cassette protein MsbA
MAGLIPFFDRALSNNPIILKIPAYIPFKANIDNAVVWLNAQNPLGLLQTLCLIFIGITLLKGFAQFLQQVTMEWVSQRIAHDLRSQLFKKYFALPSAFFAKSRTGDLIAKITNDVAVVQSIFSGSFTKMLLDSLHFFPFLLFAFVMEWKMTLFVLIVVPSAVLPIIFVGRQVKKISKKNQQNIADITSFVHEMLGALRIVKVFGQADREQERFAAVSQKSVQIRLKSQKKQALLSPLTEWIGVFTGVGLFWWLSPKVVQGEMSAGIFITYFSCIAFMIKPIRIFGHIHVMVQIALSGADRIFQLLETPIEPCETQGRLLPVSFKDAIVFDRVGFTYEGNAEVLKNISFEAKKGEVIAIVGPSGSGKTTLVNLLARFFDPKTGRVLVDGRDLKDIHVSAWRPLLGMVSQEPILFNATVAENIAYGKPDAPFQQIQNMARQARAHAFIEKMEQGYQTMIGERGIRLSGGEKQRIAIARALLRDPQIFVFDEATSALDSENEKMVQEAIEAVMRDRTVFVIAHRFTTVVKAHKILVLDQGHIVQSGTHQTLVQSEGLYKKLFEMHFTQ